MCDVGCELRAAGELEPPRLTVYKDIGRTMPGAVSNSGFCRQVMQTSVFPRIVCKILILKRKWWNWQTHHLEGVAPKGVGVQIPPSAPILPGLAGSSRQGITGLYGYLSDYDYSRDCLFFSDHRSAAAERQERRYCGCVWRDGKP